MALIYIIKSTDYTLDNKVKIDMTNYILKILEGLPEGFNGTAITPAASHLFDIKDTCLKLDSKTMVLFHHIVAQLLFLAKRGRTDILTGVAFLTTRMKGHDEDDMKKLKRIIYYLRDAANQTLESHGTRTIYCWVDVAFGVHHDMKSHTVDMMTLGKGAIYSTSQKQKLNTKSSTETEVVGVDNLMP